MSTHETDRCSDRALIEQIALRNEEASAVLFDRHAEEIHRFLALRIREAEAEDLLQEVFVRALRGASSFRGEASVRTWLYAIARLTLYERYRANNYFESLCGLFDSKPSPESLAIRSEDREQLVAALEFLPDEQAIVLELSRIDAMPHAEIAELLGISPEASRKRLERATSTLRDAIDRLPNSRPRHSFLESWRDSLMLRTIPSTDTKEAHHVKKSER